MKKYFLGAAFALFLNASAAQASVIFSETTSIPTPKGSFSDMFMGTLTPDSRITFKFTLTNFTNKLLFDSIENSSGFAERTVVPGMSSGITSALLFATANIVKTATGYIDTLVVTNLSTKLADFTAVIGGNFKKGATGSLTLTEISPVPLPASLPMFGLGLAALAGLGLRKKNQANS